MSTTITRADAWSLLNEYTTKEGLIKHALAVEAAMRTYAREWGEDAEKWGIAGLIHDFDYERYPSPEDHPFVGCGILEDRGYPEDIVHAVKSHSNHTGVARTNRMERALFAVDELCGFITAVALVRPGKRVADVPVRSVKKKLKDKAFARTVNRDDIRQGAEELGVDLGDHIGFVIQALAGVAVELGLQGEAETNKGN